MIDFEQSSQSLPQELYSEILDQLSLKDILKLRMVCSNYKDKVDQYLQEELQVKQLATGLEHSVILLKRGRVLVMGKNQHGQLGLGESVQLVNLPTEILGIEKIEQIVAGTWHTLLLTKNHEVLAMGKNDNGQLGFADREKQFIPEKIPGIHQVKSITAIRCVSALLLDNDEVKLLSKEPLAHLVRKNRVRLFPDMPVPEGIKVKNISFATQHMLALSEDGAVWGIGSNEGGNLGLPKDKDTSIWTKLPIAEKVKAIKATDLGSLVITADNTLMVAGWNKYGQFGADKENCPQFTKTSLSNISCISSADWHTLAVTENDQLVAFGSNKEAQLGIGRVVPKNIKELLTDFLLPRSGPDYRIHQVAGFFKLKNQIKKETENLSPKIAR